MIFFILGCNELNIDEKKEKINYLRNNLTKLIRKGEALEARCGQLRCEESGCATCESYSSLRAIEGAIDNLKVKISEIEMDVYTWVYTIMGNKEAETTWDLYMSLLQDQITDEEYERLFPENFLGDFKFPDMSAKGLIDRCYNELVDLVSKQNSRLAYQVLGVFLMKFRGRMTQDIRILILKNSEWKDERNQLVSEQDKSERRKYLADFREKVKNYKEGIKTEIPWGSFSINERKSINYLLRS